MSQPAVDLTLEKQPEGTIPPPPGADVEEGTAARPESNFRGVSNVQKWKKEDWMKKGALVLVFRTLTLLFSFLSFMLMVTISDFTSYTTLSFVFSIAVIAVVYTTVFVGIKGHELRTGQEVIPPEVGAWIEFIGDKLLALLLLSSATSGATDINAARQISTGPGIDQATAAISMSFIAFFCLESAALISGYNLAVQLSK